MENIKNKRRFRELLKYILNVFLINAKFGTAVARLLKSSHATAMLHGKACRATRQRHGLGKSELNSIN